jgi:hypothetical protein
VRRPASETLQESGHSNAAERTGKKPPISTNLVDNSVHNTEGDHHLSTKFAIVNLFA